MKIKNLEFKNNIFLAPMAGVTDIPFRELCKKMGAGLVYSEMISAKALTEKNKNTYDMLKVSPQESPIAVQLFGSDPFVMAKCCELFNDNPDVCILDINMGCPAPKIVKNGEGSALMKNPELAVKIVKEMKKASSKPVTAKIRKGFDSNNINAVEFAKMLEQAGVDAIAVHGRTREQMYDGKADLDIISKVKKAVSVPVIGNGDVIDAKSAKHLFEATNCDAIMIGRGAMGNPWIFREIRDGLNNREIVYPDFNEKIDVCIKHYENAIKYNGEAKAVREMRKHIAWYLKGFKDSKKIKDKINSEKSSSTVIKILMEYKNSLQADKQN
ncbi:tRNA dihydrouridine synthase DusB [Clostridium sp. JN-1]|uniref:tRNA dihydrouridine synthase DusB n=1 Tax=Clostridium sp. JN-1 TaxID=2483110 RepID=UPI000F0B1F95|nr:tRNA dihydrouridine synthase DusB [Clostridium sp. JN-1]